MMHIVSMLFVDKKEMKTTRWIVKLLAKQTCLIYLHIVFYKVHVRYIEEQYGNDRETLLSWYETYKGLVKPEEAHLIIISEISTFAQLEILFVRH